MTGSLVNRRRRPLDAPLRTFDDRVAFIPFEIRTNEQRFRNPLWTAIAPFRGDSDRSGIGRALDDGTSYPA